MGFLVKGDTLVWADSVQFLEHVKKHGLQQFLNLYNKVKTRESDRFLWGDEVEYILVKIPEDGPVSLSLESAKYQELATNLAKEENFDINLLPEYGSFMIEATPGTPYGDSTVDLLKVEQNMRSRREALERVLDDGVYLFTLGNFPLLGSDFYLDPPEEPHGEYADSDYISDSVINPHKRFGTLTRNIRMRRGEKVDIRIPLFQDENTPQGLDEIHMDAMAFGMGCCCLQVTFQARNLHEARCLYDQLATLSPIMMALGASTPFHRGMIADIDCRWTVVSQSVDDRTESERGLVENETNVINKSRYDTIDTYICECTDRLSDNLNDIDLVYDDEAYQMLIENDVDDRLAKHIAHLWIRDPLVIYSKRIEVDDEATTEHFENIQSTNWQNVRFKPPPSGTDIGWRVEFRTMEIQLTEFENAAFVVFVALLNRAIIYFKLNLYTFLSQVDINMERAHMRDAVNTQKFHFKLPKLPDTDYEAKIEELTIEEIFRGTEQHPGLISIVRTYLDEIDCRGQGRHCVDRYLDFIGGRANGSIKTTATWLREFVHNHSEYNHDSKLNPTIVRDLLVTIDELVHSEQQQNAACTLKPCIACDRIFQESVVLSGGSENGSNNDEVQEEN